MITITNPCSVVIFLSKTPNSRKGQGMYYYMTTTRTMSQNVLVINIMF